ncbi:hypothetical protein P4O66_005790 [Electrophorus voltai]|uniref:Uncharacterized protein n=1 Tax=Electrophorus voltai TaxID=2609070 RepID=A0AAD9E161_9TELE|nr:hypothetical protein P4O66_005790 [Electrophorus voltai]
MYVADGKRQPEDRQAWLQGSTRREEPTEQFCGGPAYGPGSDSLESYGDQPDHENRHLEVDSAGSYDPCLDDYGGYADYGEKGECSDVSVWSDMGSDREEDTPMEVEEDPHRDLPSHSDAKSSENDEPPAPKAPPKAPPRAYRPGASKLPRVASRESSSSEADTPPSKVKSPRAHVPTPKPRGGKKAAAPVPVQEPGNTAGALPNAHAPKPGQPPLPKPVKNSPPQAGRFLTQSMSWGLAGVPSPSSGLFHVCDVVHVPVPISIPIILNVSVTLFPFVSMPVPVSLSVPVTVIIMLPVLPPTALLTLACVRLSGPFASPFGVGLGPPAR